MKLKAYLEFRRLSQKEFAKMIGVSPTSINLYIQGRRIPSLRIAKRIEELTRERVTMHDLLDDQENNS